MTEPEVRAQVIADLRTALHAEAADALDVARQQEKAGRKGNAECARSQAWGLCRARVVLGRWV